MFLLPIRIRVSRLLGSQLRIFYFYQEEDLAIIAAQQYYIEHNELNVQQLASLIPSYIPDHLISGRGGKRDLNGWAKEVGKAFSRSYFSKDKTVSPQRVSHIRIIA